MPATYAVHNRSLTVSLSGELDHHRARGLIDDLDQELDELLPREVLVDCAHLSFMDSSGIAVLLHLLRRMQALDGRLSVTALPEQPARVLHAAGLDRLIPIE